ncbi:MAG: tetratricopeptide repeat protein [Gemmataceae bacterium]|nr:tetratricopeptide repeat protein [Gemmataceae bacterium]
MEPDRFARARILLEQNRYDLAARETTARLADDPNDPEGHILLAICQCNLNDPQAIDTARTAVELAPNEDRAHFVYSLAQLRKGNLDEAERAIRRAIEINCWNSGYFGQLAAIEVGRYRWTEALAAADQGLALDPDDRHCLNLRAVALTKLGRKSEAASTLEGALEKNPEDAYSHANRGWTLLHENEPNKAIEHFRESLRLDPTSAWAKEGMLEALRARSWFYRRVLQYLLWMSRFPPRVQFGLIISMVVLVQVLDGIGKQMPGAEPFFNVLIFGYAIFVASSWFAQHIMNVLLLFNPDGRMILDRTQKAISLLCFSLVVVVLILAAFAILTREQSTVAWAVTMFLAAIHTSSIFDIPAGRYRWIGLGLSSIAILAFGVLKSERVDLIADYDKLYQKAIQHDERAEQFRLNERELSAEKAEALKRELAVELRIIQLKSSEIRNRSDKLGTMETVSGFGSLGALLLHAFLRAKARRERFEDD